MFFIASALWLQLASAQFQVPSLEGPVLDQANVLSATTRQDLSAKLKSVHAAGGPQVQVAILRDLGGLVIEEASIRLVDEWKLGGKEADNGVLLLIALSERKVRIEVGQGLEGDLPDARASRIVREVISPHLRQGQFDAAVVRGVEAILRWTYTRDQAAEPELATRGLGGVQILILLFILALFVGPQLLLMGRRGHRLRGGTYIPGGFPTGGWGGSSGGGGWSGGGGGFSGGGASGDW